MMIKRNNLIFLKIKQSFFEEVPETAGCCGGVSPLAHSGGDIAPRHGQKRGGRGGGTHCTGSCVETVAAVLSSTLLFEVVKASWL